MAVDPKSAALGLHRFGLGPREGSIKRIANDPRGALLAELQKPNAGRVNSAGLPNGASTLRTLRNFSIQQAERANRPAPAVTAGIQAQRNMMLGTGNQMARPDMPPKKVVMVPNLPRQLYLNEAKVRATAAIGADYGFVERLVWFWSNHFCVAADKIGALAGAYEREAIRPNVLGKFSDMLYAVESHPAMLLYLDNAFSTGKNSMIGMMEDIDINENLAREIMELHTVGVRSGYSQEDVTNLAKVISGWSILPTDDTKRGGSFAFVEERHEPGDQLIWGKTYKDGGLEQGKAVLNDLARRPQTATFIATKFARHFVADEPPPALVEKLAKNFRDTDGNLREFAKTLINAPESWNAERSKLKTPAEWIVASLRTTGTPPQVEAIVRAQTVLGMPLWVPSAPTGFSDMSITWVEGVTQRLDLAAEYAQDTADKLNPIRLIDTALGPLASDTTRQTIGFAGSRQQALTLLLLAPEFQRR
ncbi:MAG TPA: DUF1800 domain-containing protein [Xanthobacteraceae bacterium]|nr:DUF1800 domain-containing protein [Xanthobacteraceae bacterium]